jgi:hypothetical protein
MTKQFGGFTQDQTEVLARKMGFKGPMDQFSNFLKSNPANSQKFHAYESKAKEMVNSASEKRGFATGGVVTGWVNDTAAPATTTPSTTTPATTTPTTTTTNTSPIGATTVGDNTTVTPNLSSTGATTTTDMIANPNNYVTQVETTPMTVSANELIDREAGSVEASPDVEVATTGETATAVAPTATTAPQVTTSTTSPAIADATADMTAVHGTVSPNAQVEAATATPSADATVVGQMEKLMSQFEGGNTPVWASGAIRNANAIMAARGLGASSMAGGAVTQAAMESAINIAAQDAATFSQFELTNLNNRQQARLQNAQAFLQMDLANLDADNQMNMFKSQSIIQGLFTDTAAENATKQFNATSQSQTDQFFASLSTQVSQFNAAQQNAMSQFNTEQTNTVGMFNRQMNDARDQFNASNRLVIDQSNATWRRSVTTANNEAANEANRINAQQATQLTLAAYNNQMQRERDFYSFAYESSENAKNRAAEIVLAKMKASGDSKAALGQALGGLAGSVVNGLFSNGFFG